MSSASSAVARNNSTTNRHHQPSYRSEHLQRVQSAKSTAPASRRRQSHERPSPVQHELLPGKITQRDFEAANVARPRSSRRSSSQDRHTSSRRSRSRHPPEMAAATAAVPNAVQPPSSLGSNPHNGLVGRRRTTIDTLTGRWALGKTIGAGSMGKVKLAKNLETGEQVAIKIVPRQSTDEHHNPRENERADRSKEIRTAREAAIVTLLDHPYICGMRDVVRTHYHWYMLTEYVNGGQMLDYIISHGRLKEKQARKFGRQIASALDYCHRNSIVHRDLKIENILISKTGDIKIIDFGLSNLFSPRGHLKTFCGSLYFAAPELLQARQYTGPEVDVWSFGIVLYVLVCGKVPFDDQSMPQLHAKIKRGVVDYPAWLSPECRGLISRMLVVDPRQRITMTEIMNNVWMNKGYNGPPENFLPTREPLQLPLDQEVIEKMGGFDFGPPEFIRAQLAKVIESEEYQNAVRLAKEQSNQSVVSDKKTGFMSFYRRRNSASKDTLASTSSEAIQPGSDPLNAFSPLISIYYLAKEKIAKEKTEANPGAVAMPQSPGEQPLKVPDIPPPEAAHTNIRTPEMPGERPTGGRTRARARTHGEDEVVDNLKKMNLGPQGGAVTPEIRAPPQAPLPKKESMATGILRRFSTRKRREPRDAHERDKNRIDGHTPAVQLQPPNDAAIPLRKSFSVRRVKNRQESPSANDLPIPADRRDPERLVPPAIDAWKFGKGLGRSASVASGEHRRRRRERAEELSVPSDPPSISNPTESDGSKASDVHRSATTRTKSLGHARRESIQARRARREEAREPKLPEVPAENLETSTHDAGKLADSTDNLKPVYLKGLFSVSTTSSKPLSFIRLDIIRVLKQLGVEYTEIRGGFSCRHAPSINALQADNAPPPSPQPIHRRHISLGFMNVDRNRDRDDHDKSPRLSKTRSNSRRRHPTGDHSFSNSEDSEDYLPRLSTAMDRDRAPGETTTRVQNDLGSNMVLHFEILVVKVPLLSMHGLQFKKVAGGTWQYKNMAQNILDRLRL